MAWWLLGWRLYERHALVWQQQVRGPYEDAFGNCISRPTIALLCNMVSTCCAVRYLPITDYISLLGTTLALEP